MRTAVVWPNAIDSADDKGAIEISGFGPEPQRRIIDRIFGRLRKATQGLR